LCCEALRLPRYSVSEGGLLHRAKKRLHRKIAIMSNTPEVDPEIEAAIAGMEEHAVAWF